MPMMFRVWPRGKTNQRNSFQDVCSYSAMLDGVLSTCFSTPSPIFILFGLYHTTQLTFDLECLCLGASLFSALQIYLLPRVSGLLFREHLCKCSKQASVMRGKESPCTAFWTEENCWYPAACRSTSVTFITGWADLPLSAFLQNADLIESGIRIMAAEFQLQRIRDNSLITVERA